MTTADTSLSARELLGLALRALCDPDATAALRANCRHGEIDWQRTRALAERTRVAPLLFRALRDVPEVPDDVRDALHISYLATARRNLLFRHELGTVLRTFAAARIPVLVLKGTALIETVYSSIALRPMHDIDVLVHRRDVGRALGVLTTIGFAADRVERQAGVDTVFECECVVFKDGVSKIPLEIHWSLFDSPYYQYALPMEWFWGTAAPVRVADARALMLGPEAQVLHLCGHLRLHHWGDELLWLHDVACVATIWRTRIDWNLVLERARAFDLVISLRDVLGRVAVEWGAPIPGAVLDELQAIVPSRREQRVVRWLTQPNRGVARRLWIDLATMPSWPRRLAFAWSNLFPSRTYMCQRYRIRRPLLVPFYYPYRWMRALRGAR